MRQDLSDRLGKTTRRRFIATVAALIGVGAALRPTPARAKAVVDNPHLALDWDDIEMGRDSYSIANGFSAEFTVHERALLLPGETSFTVDTAHRLIGQPVTVGMSRRYRIAHIEPRLRGRVFLRCEDPLRFLQLGETLHVEEMYEPFDGRDGRVGFLHRSFYRGVAGLR